MAHGFLSDKRVTMAILDLLTSFSSYARLCLRDLSWECVICVSGCEWVGAEVVRESDGIIIISSTCGKSN